MTQSAQDIPFQAYSLERLLEKGAVVNINVNGRDVNMFNNNSKNMNGANFQGATFTGNQNFLSDNNTQTFQTGLSDDTKEMFELVLKEIRAQIQDPDDQQDNIEDLNKVKEAAESGNKDRIVKFFSRLGKGIQISSAGVALAKNLGISALLSL